jgi:hypothetical protein
MILIRSIVRLAIRVALRSLSNDHEDRSQLEYFPLEDLKTIYLQELYRAVVLLGWPSPLQKTADLAGVDTRTVARARDKKIF